MTSNGLENIYIKDRKSIYKLNRLPFTLDFTSPYNCPLLKEYLIK